MVSVAEPEDRRGVLRVLLKRRLERGDLLEPLRHHPLVSATRGAAPRCVSRSASVLGRDALSHAEVACRRHGRGLLYDLRLEHRVRDDVADEETEQDARNEELNLVLVHPGTDANTAVRANQG